MGENNILNEYKYDKKEERIYKRNDCVVFLKTKEVYGGLSNMAAGYNIQVNNVVLKTSEALYQAYRFPNHPEIQLEIINQNSPMTAKMKSKKFRVHSRKDWEDVRVSIMRWCLRAKLFNNWNKFGALLTSTNNLPIVEESKKDSFWGAKAIDEETLKGMNILGRLLMETREIYFKYNNPGMKLLLKPLPIRDFLILDEPVKSIYHIVEDREINENQLNNQSDNEQLSIKEYTGLKLGL